MQKNLLSSLKTEMFLSLAIQDLKALGCAKL